MMTLAFLPHLKASSPFSLFHFHIQKVENFMSTSSSKHHKSTLSEADFVIGNYRVEKTIGQGTYGKVRLGIHLETKEKVILYNGLIQGCCKSD